MRNRAAERGVAIAVAPLVLGLLVANGAAAYRPPVDDDLESVTAPLTLEQLLAIRHPSEPTWSPEGDRIAFLWQDGGAVDLWWVSEEIDEPRPVSGESRPAEGGVVTGFCWTSDGGALVYALADDLYTYRLATREQRNLTDSSEVESDATLSPDGTRLAFVRDGAVWLASFPEMDAAPLTAEEGAFRSLAWSPDGRYLMALHGDRERIMEETTSLVGDKLEFYRSEETPADIAVVEVETGAVHWLERGDAYSEEAAWSSDGRLAWQEIAADARQRRILLAGPPDWQPRAVVEEIDEAWWSLTYLEAGPRWAPDGRSFAYISDRDGWAHVYLVTPDAEGADASPLQLTRGEFEVEAPAWDPGGARLVVSANRGSATERGLFLVGLDEEGAQPGEMEPISRLRGTSSGAVWRPDGRRLAFLHADPENPVDIWVQAPGDAEARQLTESWPEAADVTELIVPIPVRFGSSDGELVPAQLILPPDEAAESPVPGIVWVHGGGIRQNRFGWHPMRGYAIFYGFHQYLAQRGYAVLAVDYRGSIGYGRDFRVAQHMDLGGLDLDDVLAGARYLRRLREVEIGRVAVWGLSYGGYLTLQALVRAPTAFDAGIDVAGVADWEAWAVDPGGLWIDGRMGPAAQNSELYRERSPVHFVEQLVRPLLILHGTADRPVPVLQSLRLIDALVRENRDFEAMIYPGEQHVFEQRRTWLDAFRRTEGFLDRTLR